MGTNYYLYDEACPHCGRSNEPLHIGKSSFGWVFLLHVDPDDGIHDLEDWKQRWSKPGAIIKDEYDREVTPEQMLCVITERWMDKPPEDYGCYAILGPKNLLREVVDGRHCVGHGAGTWDLHAGEFS